MKNYTSWPNFGLASESAQRRGIVGCVLFPLEAAGIESPTPQQAFHPSYALPGAPDGAYPTASRQVRQHPAPASTPDAREHVHRECPEQQPSLVQLRLTPLLRLLLRKGAPPSALALLPPEASHDCGSLVSSKCEELPGLIVCLKPLPPGEVQCIVVESDVAEREVRGSYILKLWAGEAGAGEVTLGGVMFP